MAEVASDESWRYTRARRCSTMKRLFFGTRRVWLALALGLGLSCLVAPVRACSQLPRIIESSYPAEGAIGVPTNVVLYAAGEQLEAEAFSLETQSGTRVETTVSRVLPTGFDIRPVMELEPNQRYVLRHPGFSLLAAGPMGVSVEFETGGGPTAPALLSPPQLEGAALLDSVEAPCPYERLCLEPGGSDSALFAATSFNNLSERRPGTLTGAYGNALRPDSCAQVWRRDALGNRSDILGLCAADLQRHELFGDAASRPCDEYRPSRAGSDEAAIPSCALALDGSPLSSRCQSAAFALFVLGACSWRRSSARRCV